MTFSHPLLKAVNYPTNVGIHMDFMENHARDEVLKNYNLEFLKNYNFYDSAFGHFVSLKYLFYKIFYKLNINDFKLKSEFYYVNNITTKYSRKKILQLCQDYFLICKCSANHISDICYLCRDNQHYISFITYGKCLKHYETDSHFTYITPCYCGFSISDELIPEDIPFEEDILFELKKKNNEWNGSYCSY